MVSFAVPCHHCGAPMPCAAGSSSMHNSPEHSGGGVGATFIRSVLRKIILVGNNFRSNSLQYEDAVAALTGGPQEVSILKNAQLLEQPPVDLLKKYIRKYCVQKPCLDPERLCHSNLNYNQVD